MSENIPEKLNEKFPILSQNGMEVHILVKEYNNLPLTDSRKRGMYEKIKDRISYEQIFE